MKRRKIFLILISFIFVSSMVFSQFTTLRNYKLPDLKIELVKCPEYANVGHSSSHGLVAKITNVGKFDAKGFFVDFVLSKTKSVPIKLARYSSHYFDGVLLKGGRFYVKYLKAGASVYKGFNSLRYDTIPLDTPSGAYYFAAVADSGNSIKEITESNNIAYCVAKVVNRGEEEKLPDLVVKNIKVTKNCELEVTIANVGNGQIPSSLYGKIVLQMYVDNKAGGGMVLSVFDPTKKLQNPGTSLTVNWFPTATRGRIGDGLPHQIKLIVDDNNALRESNENNNVYQTKLSCGEYTDKEKLPDLVVQEIRVLKECELEVTIANKGNGSIPSSLYNSIVIQMFVDNKTGGAMVLGVFDPNKKLQNPGSSVTINWFPTATKSRIGDKLPHMITVIADEGNRLTESNENNNTLKKQLSCGEQ